MLIEKSLFKAIKIFHNKQKLLAQAIGEKPDKIRYWLNKSGKIPFHNAIAIELATKGKVSRFDLAPYARFKTSIELPQIPKISLTEKVSIGIALEKSLGNRNGRRCDLAPSKMLNGRTDVIAAKHAGFGNHISYRQAKKIVTKGIYKLSEAIDEKLISISVGSIIAELSPEQQEEILHHHKKQIIALVKKIKLTGEI
jgi:DNA-binding transcriptional regulator YdaS (Cro superfamily)